ncbi:hypothetical protein [Clostridium guangxiense]|uniref:hypothetical protein n=1 Tax=Clostridium guangxiense TaxID=1662055 RepID=UPI001E3190C8|nr:hypothetical protein [Clostridium guangxiense]MCD2347823.1 hypothetical protein [Clostridium guangxiense]
MDNKLKFSSEDMSKFLNSFLEKFTLGSALVALQAIILSFGVIEILNINAAVSLFWRNFSNRNCTSIL